MKVKSICKESSDLKLLTLNKVYEVVNVFEHESGKTFYSVIDDEGKLENYYSYRFEIVKEEDTMKEFLNENKLQFKDLTDEEKLLIIEEKMKGNVEYTNGFGWNKASESNLKFGYIYRTKPIKKLDIPWQFIKPEFKWAAMDKDERICVFTASVKVDYDHGMIIYEEENKCHYLSDVLNIDTTGVDWKTSLTQRPDGV